jgi:hypothetical protein
VGGKEKVKKRIGWPGKRKDGTTGMGLVAEAVAVADSEAEQRGRSTHNLEALKGERVQPSRSKIGQNWGERKAGSAGNQPGQADQPADPTCRHLTLAHSHFKPPVRCMRC